MKNALFIAALSIASFPTFAGGQLNFKSDTYSASEQTTIQNAIQLACSELLNGRRASLDEQSTTVEVRRVDQNISDMHFTTHFTFVTNEAAFEIGKVIIASERLYSGEFSTTSVNVEPSHVCSW